MKTFALTNQQTKSILEALHKAQMLIISIVLILSFAASSKAANKTWTNGGGTGNWSDASNWSGGVPGASDAAIFNSTYPISCNINTDVAIASITISAGYTGTITQQTGHTITLTSNYSQSDGVFVGGNANIAISGSFTLSTGTFTSTSATMSIQNSFTVNSGTFNHNSGTLLFDQAGATTINVPNGSFDVYNLTFNSSVGNNMSNTDTLVVHGTLSLLQNQVKNGVIRLASGAHYADAVGFLGGTCQLEVAAPITVNVTCAEFFGIILNDAGAVVNMPSNDITIDGLVNINAGTFNGGTHNITFSLNNTQSGGTFNASTAIMSFYKNYVNTGGTFTHNNGTVIFTSTGNVSLKLNSTAFHFYNFEMNRSTSAARVTLQSTDTLVTDGTLTLTQGTMNAGYMEPDGGLSVGAFYAGGSTKMLIKAANTYTFNAGVNVPYLVLDNPGATINLNSGSSVVFTNNINIMNGTFNCGSNKLTLNTRLTMTGGTFISTSDTLNFNDSNLIINAGATFDHNHGTVLLSRPAGNITLNTANSITFYNVIINQTNTTSTKARLIVASGDTMIVENSLVLDSGYLYNGVVKVEGDLTDQGWFSGGTATLLFSGGSGSRNITLQSPVQPVVIIDDPYVSVSASTANDLTFGSSFTLLNGEFFPDVYPITFSTTYTQSGGTFWDGVARETFVGNFVQSGGDFYATADTLDFQAASFTLPASGTGFYHNNGTVLFSRSAGGVTITNAQKQAFYNAIINLSNATQTSARFTVASSDTIVVENNLELEAGNLYTGTIELRGGLTDDGTFSGGGAASGVLYIANGAGARSLTFASPTQPALNIDDANASLYASGTSNITMIYPVTLTAGHFYPQSTPVTFNTTFTQTGGTYHTGTAKAIFTGTTTISGGTFYAPSDTLDYIGTSFVIGSSATFNHSNGTLEFNNATTNATFNIPTTLNAYNVYVNMQGATNNILTITSTDTLVVNNTLSLVNGRINTGVVKLVGDFSDLQTFAGGSATIYFGQSASLRTVNMSANTLPNIYVNDGNITLNGPTSGTANIQGNITLAAGTIKLGVGNVSVSGSYTQTAGTLKGGAGNLSITGSVTISNNASVFKAPTGTLSIGGNLTINSPATFNHNGGTLEFTGGATTVINNTAGTLTLNNLLLSLTGSAQLRPRQSLIMLGDLTIGSASILNQSTYNVDLTVDGNYNDQNSAGGLTYGTRSVKFAGSSAQTLTTSASVENFYKLYIENTSGGVRLNNDVYVYNLLSLTPSTGGKMYLGNSNLTINSAASITGGTSSEFVITDGNGYLQQENIGATGRNGSILFPVGKDAIHYAPVTVLNSGTNDRFEVNVSDHAYSDPIGLNGLVYTAALNQTYHVEEQTPGGSNVTLTIQWDSTVELPRFDRNSCSIRHYTGGAWVMEGVDGPSSGSGPYTLTATGITSFSPFDGGSGGGSLPIELASFTGKLTDNNQVALDWSTQIEVNNHYFTIERSADGVNYTELARVEGAGNSTEPKQYTLLDSKPLAGANYYRLKQTDYDGQFKYVGVVAVNTNKANNDLSATVYPNPLDGRTLSVELTGNDATASADVMVTVTDLSGRVVYTNNMGTVSHASISLPNDMAAGMYLVSIDNGSKVYQQKLLVR